MRTKTTLALHQGFDATNFVSLLNSCCPVYSNSDSLHSSTAPPQTKCGRNPGMRNTSSRVFSPRIQLSPLKPVQKQASDSRFPAVLLPNSDSEQPNDLWASSRFLSEQINWGFVTPKEGTTHPEIIWLLTVAIPSFIRRLQSSQIRSAPLSHALIVNETPYPPEQARRQVP